MGRLLSPHKDGNPIALKYLSDGLLQTNIQSGVHSSLNDRLATLKLFHLAPKFIMERFQTAIKRESILQNLLGYLYEPCKEMSYAFKTLSNRLEYWPLELLDIYEKEKKKRRRVYSDTDFAEPVSKPFITP